MDNAELRQAISELVTIAIDSISETISALTAETAEPDIEEALSACIGHVDTIVMAAEMAESDTLLAHSQETRDFLSSLIGQDTRYLQRQGQDLLDWSRAVLAYVQNPDDVTLCNQLQLPPPLAPGELLVDSSLEWVESATEDHGSLEAPVAHTTERQPDPTTMENPTSTTDWSLGEPAPEIMTTSDVASPETVSAFEPEEVAWPGIEPNVDDLNRADAAERVVEIQFDEVEATNYQDALPVNEPMVSDILAEDEMSQAPVLATGQVTTHTTTDRDIESDDKWVNHLPVDHDASQALVTTESADFDSGWSNDAASLEGAEWTNDETSDDAFDIIQQITQSFDDLARLQMPLTMSDTTEIEIGEAAHAYIDIVSQLQALSEQIGLSGLSAIYEHVAYNVSRLAEQTPAARACAHKVLTQWPELVCAYLGDFTDDANSLALINLLKSEAWPVPFDPIRSESLFMALSPTMAEPLGAEERPSVAGADDVALTVAEDVDPRLIEVFLRESPDHAAKFSACIADISRGEDVFSNLNAARRLSHSLKGSANLVGVKGIANLTHHVEDILEYLSDRHLTPPPALVQTLQEAADSVEMMLEALQGGGAAPIDVQRILQDVFDWAKHMDTGQLEAPPPTPSIVDPEPQLNPVSHAPVILETEPVATPHATAATTSTAENAPAVTGLGKVLRIPVETVDDLFRTVGELSIALDQLQGRLASIRRQSNEL